VFALEYLNENLVEFTRPVTRFGHERFVCASAGSFQNRTDTAYDRAAGNHGKTN
jgi:hypothetical protein